MSNSLDNVVIRELNGINEYKATEQFQRDVWGEDDPADNADLLLAIAHAGGLVAAAFLSKQIIGLVFGFPTSDPTVQHSHRLAVHPQRQGSGLGTRLKWYQRDWRVQRGIKTIRWTYDPIRRANATLNIATLGAGAREYHDDYYGNMAGINAGVPSDRIVAEWLLLSPRVISCAEGLRNPADIKSTTRLVAIPQDFSALLCSDGSEAYAERIRVRTELKSAFNAGFHINGFLRNTGQYVLYKDNH